MSFGERLQALRHSNGLTQVEFAEQLKVSRQAVSKWESSRGYPEIEKIIYICNHYGVSMNELFLDEVPPQQCGGGIEEQDSSAQTTLKTPSLKNAFGNFFTNLSPGNRLVFGIILTVVALALVTLLCTTLSKGAKNPVLWKIVWAALLILFGIGEAVTVGLTSIWFAAGSLAALVVALLNGPLWLQIVLFLLISLLSLLAIRPIASKYLNSKVEPTNADRIIGQKGIVTEEVNQLGTTGRITVMGQSWAAVSEDGTIISPEEQVVVTGIQGVKAIVKKGEE